MYNNTTPRICWIDLAKGWTLLFVIIYHAVTSIYNANLFPQYKYLNQYIIFIIGTFIMPVFFALSGLVYKKISTWHEYLTQMSKRAVSLAIPYIVFSVAYVFMQNLSPGSSTHAVHSWTSMLSIFSQPISYLWYIYTLVLIYFLSGFFDLCKLSVKTQFVISFVLFITAASISLPGFIKLMFTWTLPFISGRLLKEYSSLFNAKYISGISLVLIAAWIFQIQLNGVTWYDTNNLTISTFVSKLACIPIFFTVYQHLTQTRLNNLLQQWGRDSLIIYLVHAPAVSALRAIFVKIGINDYFIMVSSVIIIATLISIFACYLAKKISCIEFIFYPTRYIHLPK